MTNRRVSVHLHLPRLLAKNPACISVKEGNQPVRYRGTVCLRNARFVVSEAGRQRTLRDKVKNVHAWVKGEVDVEASHQVGNVDLSGWNRATYNPYRVHTFVDALTHDPIFAADSVLMIGKEVYYRNATVS